MKTLHNEKSPDECPACKESVWVNADRLMTRDETILEVIEYIRTKLVGKSYTDAKYVADDIEEYFQTK